MKPQHYGLSHPRGLMLSAVILGFLFIGVWWWKSASIIEEEYASFTRADQQYRMVVTRKRSAIALMPGQTSDSPGTVRLIDRAGTIIREVDVEMVQLVDHVDWQNKKVSIKLVADWDLPD